MRDASSCNYDYNQPFFQTKGKWGQQSDTFSSVLSRSSNTRYYELMLRGDAVCGLSPRRKSEESNKIQGSMARSLS
jgi:hypothetical protein